MPGKPWVVLKYGGTSVATAKNWGIISRRVASLLPTNRVWVVVSAVTKVTNALLAALDEAVAADGSGTPPPLASGAATEYATFDWIVGTHERLAADMGLSEAEYAPVAAQLRELKNLLAGARLTQEVSPRLRARVAAYGELLSSQLGIAYFAHAGLNAVRVDSRQLLTSDADVHKHVSPADAYLEADVRPVVNVDRAEAAAGTADVVLAQGFIASTPTGATCLLGRGGSDTSGALFAALCGAQRLEIWTDVNGMFTADPRFVPAARLIRHLTYREAQELAAMGAKVLHPRCLLPAAFAGIPVEVRNTMDDREGAELTVVCATTAKTPHKRSGSVTAATAACDARDATWDVSIGPITLPPLGTSTTASNRGGAAALPAPACPAATTTADADGTDATPVAPWHRAASDDCLAALVTSSPPPSPPPMVDRTTGGAGAAAESPTSTASAPSFGSPVRSGAHTPTGLLSAGACGDSKILAVSRRKGVTLLNMESFDMWGHAGWLARVFAPFGTHGISVDLIATSQYAVTVTLDHIPDGVGGETFSRLLASLSSHCTTTVRHPCAVVSVVGRSLRTALPKIGAAMGALGGLSVHMVSEASEDLNMSFVVDEDVADQLVCAFHASLLEGEEMQGDSQFGPTWRELPCGSSGSPAAAAPAATTVATAAKVDAGVAATTPDRLTA